MACAEREPKAKAASKQQQQQAAAAAEQAAAAAPAVNPNRNKYSGNLVQGSYKQPKIAKGPGAAVSRAVGLAV